MRTFLKLLSVVFLSVLFLWIFLLANIYINSKTQDRDKVDAIVVLGASQWNGRPSPALQARLDHAYDLYKADVADYVILTGGIAKGDTISESRVGKNYLNKKGIPNSGIIIEEEGKNTKESLLAKRLALSSLQKQRGMFYFRKKLILKKNYPFF